MPQRISAIALLVNDYDEAVHFFTHCLGFKIVEDTKLSDEKRWVTVQPAGGGTALLLAKGANPAQTNRVGDQTGGRVFLFLETDNFWHDYREMQSKGVKFLEEPRNEAYGDVVVFLDLYGNRWDLIGPRTSSLRSE